MISVLFLDFLFGDYVGSHSIYEEHNCIDVDMHATAVAEINLSGNFICFYS